jgi:hypothetical protein
MTAREQIAMGLPLAALGVLGALAMCAPTKPPELHNTAPGATHELELTYRTWGLMPVPRCGGATYEIALARDHTVTCGWRSECPPYSEAAPLKPTPHGALTATQVDALAELAGSPAFFALRKFDANIHIIDGGEESLDVRVDSRVKTVELANMNAPPFSALRDALEAATGCSLEKAGPPPT